MLDSETKRRIDTLRDILVGKIPNPQSQVEQITTGLIYKFMNDMDEESIELGGDASFFVGDYEKYAWKNLFDSKLGGVDRVILYSEAIENMYFNPSAPQLFRDIFKNAFLPFKDPSTLNMFIKEIDEFHYSHSEKLGDAFEYLISIMGSQGDAGQFRTPRHIIDFIVEIVNPQKDENILDPACGTAGFLISSYKHILKSNTSKKLGDELSAEDRKKVGENLSGYDISPEMIRLSLVNMYLHGFKTPKVEEYDTLSSEDKWNEYFDVILANPPFFSPKGGIQPHKRFGVESKKAEVLFTSYILDHLKPNGRAGIIIPEGIIFQTNKAYKELRKQLVENGLIGVISLPAGVFNPYSGVKTSILILDKKLSKERSSIFFATVNNDGYSLGAQRTQIKDNDLDLIIKKISIFSDTENSDNFKIVKVDEIMDSKDINLSSTRYEDEDETLSSFELENIKDYTTFQRGTSKSGKDFIEGEIPVVAGGKKPASYCNESNRKENIITISSSGANAGFVNFYKTKIFATDCFTIRTKSESLRQDFLYCLLKNKQDKIYKMQTGGAQPHVYSRDFDNFKIPLPPIKIQKEIVDEIEIYQKIIDGCKQVVDNYNPTIDIDLSWEKSKLESLCTIVRGSSPRPKSDPRFYGGTVPRLMVADLTRDGVFVTPQKDFLTELGATKSRAMKKGDVVIAVSGNPGLPCILEIDCCIHDGFVGCRDLSPKIDAEYLCYLLLTLKSQTSKQSVGAVFQNLTTHQLKTLELPIPPKEKQDEIVTILRTEYSLVEGNKKLIKIYTQKIQKRINKVWGE